MTLSLSHLLRISRPRFWLYELGTFFIGVLAGALAQETLWSVDVLIFAMLFLFPANLFIYGINDIYDYETDIQNPKKTGYEQVLPREVHRTLISTALLLSLPFLLYGFTSTTPAIIALFTFFFFAYFYSAPPIRAKARPFFDSVFSAGHYVATAVFGYYLVGGNESIWVAVVAGMSWAIAMHAYSAVPDIKADTSANLSTIATTLGHDRTILLCLFLYTLSALIAYMYIGLVSVVFYIPFLFMMLRSLKTTDSDLLKLYTYFPPINALVGMGLFFALLFQKGWL